MEEFNITSSDGQTLHIKNYSLAKGFISFIDNCLSDNFDNDNSTIYLSHLTATYENISIILSFIFDLILVDNPKIIEQKFVNYLTNKNKLFEILDLCHYLECNYIKNFLSSFIAKFITRCKEPGDLELLFNKYQL